MTRLRRARNAGSFLWLELVRYPHFLGNSKLADNKFINLETTNSSATDRKPTDCESTNGQRTDCDCPEGQCAYCLGTNAFRPKAEMTHLPPRLGAGKDPHPIVIQSRFTAWHLIIL